ncbi:DUF6022 family protein [Ktedonospora formicarum]|uniref:Uncharacterized protein n=1 Tax=Ktedonospora formicarum TaxID=2778364 RepID=A0A8J3MTE9_9CHLR|nr:DUF6022 family protein [Ktedonospora formicarum]GHO45851.1 hypothetical protein KSX_40140 [Ktedonospora formicarum]
MTTLTEAFSLKGRTIETTVAYIQQFIDEHYQQVLQEYRQELEEIFARVSEPAYARYSQLLFQPVYDELKQAGLICDPAFPGTFPLSREQWGPQQERERRFWCVLHQEQTEDLGALVTCLFHDHSSFRIPRRPVVLSSILINQSVIAQMIEKSAIPGLQQY